MTQEMNNQTHQPTTDQQAQKSKRTRKTLEQQLAEIKDREQEIKIALRKKEDRKKIVFGTTVISMLKVLREKGDQNGEAICELVDSFAQKKQPKDYNLIHEVIEKLREIK